MIKILINRLLILFIALVVLILFEPVVKYAQYHFHTIYSGQIKFFREGNQSPDRWILGYLTDKYFFFTNKLKGEDIRLDKVKIYFKEGKLKELTKGAPTKHRNWKKGYLNTKDNNFEKIQFRLRGENARNYALKKKSYKIKLKKKKLINGYREFYYINPYDINIIKNYIPFLFANELNILNPFSRLVELHTNDKYQGVHLEMYATDELFLRNNSLMPTSIFKHSIDLSYKFIEPMYTAFWNGNLFFRQSKNNFDLEDNRSILNNFLYKLRNVKHSAYKDNLNIDLWAKFAVYRILSGDFHSNALNNLKINVDNHNGKIQNIIWDPITDTKLKYDSQSLFNYCVNIIECRLNTESDYRYKKIKLLYEHLFIRDTYKKIINEINRHENKITNSLIKDSNRLDLILDNRSFIKEFFYPGETISNEFKMIKDYYNNNSESIKKFFMLKINAKWSQKKNIINIYINDFKPITNFDINSNRLIKNIYLDVNNNGLIDVNDKVIENYNYDLGKNSFKLLLFSNVACTDKRSFQKCIDKNFNYSRYQFLLDKTEKNIKVESIKTVDEFLSNKTYKFEKIKDFKEYYSTDPRNSKIIEKAKILVIDKDQFVYENLIFDQKVIIKPGVNFYLKNKKSVIFKNRVYMQGTKKLPIKFTPIEKEKYYGTVALLGKKASNSYLNNVIFENGSGNMSLENITFISMLAIHDTNNIILENIKLSQNNDFDDLIHIIYSNEIKLKNIEINNSKSDAIDIDLSTVDIDNLTIKNSGNDCLDLMMSEVTIKNSKFNGCGDKGISVGEKSTISIENLKVENSNIGLAAKDNSHVNGSFLNFNNNKVHIDTYNKNWQYGQIPSNVSLFNSKFFADINGINIFKTQGDNTINLDNVIINGNIEYTKNVKIN